jgi:hypothetical protein
MPNVRLPEDVVEEIKFLVWSGFKNCEDIVDDLLELYEDDEDLDEDLLEDTVFSEFDRKCDEEKQWPANVDGDRISDLFDELMEIGLIAVENVGETAEEGLGDIEAVFNDWPEDERDEVVGYCFFSQDALKQALGPGGLVLYFGDVDGDPAKACDVGRTICQVAKDAGFKTTWDGSADSPIEFVGLKWRRSSAAWGRSRLHQQITYVALQRAQEEFDYWTELTHPECSKGFVRISPKIIRIAYPLKESPLTTFPMMGVRLSRGMKLESYHPQAVAEFTFPAAEFPMDEVAEFVVSYFRRVWDVKGRMCDLEWDDSEE